MKKDLSKAKKPLSSIYPEDAIDAVGLGRVEPIITPAMLKNRHILGLPLVLPLTKTAIGDEILADIINRSMNLAEADIHANIQPVITRVKVPYRRDDFLNWSYIQYPHKPIQKLVSFRITSSNYRGNDTENDQYPSQDSFFDVPLDWVEAQGFQKGQINVVPLMPALSASMGGSLSGSGAAFLYFLSMKGIDIPAFFTLEALVGFCTEDGRVPVIVNELVGCRAGMLVCDTLATQYNLTSSSLGIDGLSQSVGNQLSQLIQAKRQQLEADYLKLVNRIKTLTADKFISTAI